MSFVHLHCHTHYSLLDGLPRPHEYIQRAAEDNMKAIAMTDHGNMYGAIEFYKAARKADIKPIIGIEAYTAATSRFSKQAGIDNQISHLILLARNNTGYENLLNLTTKANLEGFYYKPRMDRELLKEYSEGLIMLSGCLNGDIAKSLVNNRGEEALEHLKEFQEIFGKENVYLELQDHPTLMEQGILNERLVDLSSRTGAPLVATNDCHCLSREDKEAHDILLCIQTGSTIHDENRFKIDADIFMRTSAEMQEAFADHPEAISNTVEIAERCDVQLSLNEKNILPVFETPFGKSDDVYLRELCEEGLKERYGDDITEEITERLDYELSIVHQMGFDAYFLIVHDFVAFAKNTGILVGPGRGSAAGSLIAYCLKITDVDPMKYGLIFERFLNPERVSMPDIDIDFADNRREEVLEYVVEKYGKDHVAQVITFGTMAARAAIRDVGRALGLPYGEVDVIAKLIPARPGVKLREALDEEPELAAMYKSNPSVKRHIDFALKLEGVVRHSSVHACAVVISDKPLTKYTPLQLAPRGDQETIITQYEMNAIESIGLLKMDFLGLKNLTIMDYALEIIKRTKDVEIDLDKIPLGDEMTFELMARGETTGVFQFESPGMQRYLRELKPSRFEDLIAMNALYRPGPMDWIPSYIKGKHDENSVEYLHPSFKTILKETHGVAVYQEQILQLAQLVAGFSLGEADILRKAVGKKIAALLAKQRVKFIEGAVEKGHTKKFAKDVFEKVIEPFAGYGFNKAHATCYAMIAYRTAYLKSHYPAEFMAALMTSDRDNTERIVIEINECESMGIRVLPPAINESMANFTVVNDTNVRFGLAAIKGVGIGTVREILAVREKGGAFKSIDDFARRVPYNLLNKKTLEALFFAGAFDDLEERKVLVASIEEISSFARLVQTSSREGQTDIFSMLDDDDDQFFELKLAKVPPAGLMERLNWEKQYLGLYVSGHPLQGLTHYLTQKATLLKSLTRGHVGRTIKVAGILTQVKTITTKSGSQMAYLTMEDSTARIDVTVFPRTFQQFRGQFSESSVVVITARVELRRDSLQLICQGVQSVSLESMIRKAKEAGHYRPERRVHIQQVEIEDETPEEVASPRKSAAPLPSSGPVVIRVDESKATVENLQKLKQVLLSHRGDQKVEIHIPQRGVLKRIKVPFGIKVSTDLQDLIAKVAVLQSAKSSV
jgi:DNA polymerase-3 subunit alpha